MIEEAMDVLFLLEVIPEIEAVIESDSYESIEHPRDASLD